MIEFLYIIFPFIFSIYILLMLIMILKIKEYEDLINNSLDLKLSVMERNEVSHVKSIFAYIYK